MSVNQALVPKMTSNTTPSGEVIYIGSRSLSYPSLYKAFNNNTTDTGNPDNSGISGSGTLNDIIAYHFSKKICCTNAHFEWAYNWAGGTSHWIKIKLQGSNDGTNWVDLSDWRQLDQSSANRIADIVSTDKKTQFEYLGIKYGEYNLPNNTAMPIANEIQFYGDLYPGMKALVPKMTSMTEPSGEIIYTPEGGTVLWNMWNCFDRDETTYGGTVNGVDVVGTGRREASIGYHFDNPVKPERFTASWGVSTTPTSGYKFTIIFQGSKNGTNWVDLTEELDFPGNPVNAIDFPVTKNKDTYSYLRLLYTGYSTRTSAGYPQAAEIQFYGDPNPHIPIKSAGDTAAIRDWLNASLYNKEEIDNLFIQNNQTGLIPYDLTIQGYEPEQYVKLVGQTSGKVYNLCLAALMGDSMGKAKIYDPVINSDALNNVDGKIFVKGNIAFCNVQPNYKTTGSSNKHIFTIPEEIRPCSFVTFETGNGAHTNVCGYGYIDPTDGKVYTSNEHNNYQYMSMCWLIPDETVNFKSQDSSIESMLGGEIGIIGKDMAYISTKVHLGSHASGWKVPLLELPESIAPVNNYDFIPVVRMLSAVNGNINSFRDAHYELNNDKCCVNVFAYDGDYDIWVTGYWKFK